MRNLFLFAAALLSYSLATSAGNAEIPPANPPPGADLFNSVAGKWAWEGASCADSAHTLAFTDNKARLVYTASKPYKSATGEAITQSRYNVLYAEGNKITMYLEDETRRTDHGDRVIWVLILKSPNTYAWRRTDWPSDVTTKDILRCQ